MGRRKIEIKAIKDDRNRSVTFLKRKGGLFKKAHELSVLCSVDVAVIIFGHNKKLHEFSSGDINEMIGRHQYYGTANEHKGPSDFNGRNNIDDDDDDEMGTTPPEIQEMHIVHPHLQQSSYQHVRQHTPSASPPIPNGAVFRHTTPQPTSRPTSRNQVRRASSVLAPPNHGPVSQPPHMANGYATYAPDTSSSVYNPQAGAGMPNQPPHYAPPTSQAPQAYMHEQRRPSVPPPTFKQELAPPTLAPPSPPHKMEVEEPRIKTLGIKARSIFTPVDGSMSNLASHWGFGPSTDTPKPPKPIPPRSQSVTSPPHPLRPQSERSSISSLQDISLSRTDTGTKRPQLKVQIPSEPSEGSATANSSSPKDSGTAGGGPSAKAGTDGSHSSGVVLPPPSPSASALMSAGAQGPPNPFARPHPPGQSSGVLSDRNTAETPISALPSRFVDHGLLPSPSSFYPDWGFGGGKSADSNMLPSPLNFQTPLTSSGLGFGRDDILGEGKRKTPDGEDGGGGKRLKAS
ncbi:MAG: hypothetical protein M1814_003378 [Vezdaea aestivalis]|nr:MAG: hypothetical protein M1814_003378 [Vezdaea aestivalis]